MLGKNKKKNIFSTLKGSETNWLIMPQTISLSSLSANPHRLNDFDSNILEERAYVNVDDEPLKLEYRIEEKEKVLKDLNNKIKAADLVGNQQDLFSLRVKKQRIEKELRDLYKEYSGKDLPSKFEINRIRKTTGKHKMPVINIIKRFIKRQILARISRRFKSLVALGDSLETLAAINQNVDELIKMKTPYGETSQNYARLTEYLYKANKIRSQISKSMSK